MDSERHLLRIELDDGRILSGWRTIPYLPVVVVYLLLEGLLLLALTPRILLAILQRRLNHD